MKATEDWVISKLHIDPNSLDTKFILGILDRALNECFESAYSFSQMTLPMR